MIHYFESNWSMLFYNMPDWMHEATRQMLSGKIVDVPSASSRNSGFVSKYSFSFSKVIFMLNSIVSLH